MCVTAQTTAASATEELWNEYDFVVNQRRTRRTSLLKGRAEELVRVHAKAVITVFAVNHCYCKLQELLSPDFREITVTVLFLKTVFKFEKK